MAKPSSTFTVTVSGRTITDFRLDGDAHAVMHGCIELLAQEVAAANPSERYRKAAAQSAAIWRRAQDITHGTL